LLPLLCIGPLKAHNEGHINVDIFGCLHHTICHAVAAHNPSEDVDQDGLHVRVFQNNAEASFYGFRTRGATDIEEVSRLATCQLDDIHRGHRQPSPVDHAANVTIQANVVKIVFAGLYFQRIFFVDITQHRELFVTEEGVVVEIYLGIHCYDLTLVGPNERVNLSQGRIAIYVRLIKRHNELDACFEGRSFEAERKRKTACLEGAQANGGIDERLLNLLGRFFRYGFDLDATLGGDHDGIHGRLPVEGHSDVVLLGNINRIGDQERAYLLALRTGLVRHEIHPQDIFGVGAHLVNALGQLHAATLASAPGVDLGFHHKHGGALLGHGLGRFDGLIDRPGHATGLHRYTVRLKDILCLILVYFHDALSVKCRLVGVNTACEGGPHGAWCSFANPSYTSTDKVPTASLAGWMKSRGCFAFVCLPPPPLTTFDWHIIRRLMSGFFLLTGGLLVFYILIHYLEHVDDFLERGAEMQEVFFIYYPALMPEIIRLISPLAIFLASVYLTGKLAQQLELTAIQTSGVSLYRLLLPYLLVGLMLTGFMFWFNGWVVPVTNQTALDFEDQYLASGPAQLDVSDIHRQNGPGSIVTVSFYDRRDEMAHRVSIQQFDAERSLRERIDARRMWWEDSLNVWRMSDVTIREFNENGAEQRRSVSQMDTVLNVFPRDLARTDRDVESMTIPVAADYVAALERSGVDQMGITLVGYYAKFSYPLANLIVILIAVPLASVRRRGGQAVQLGLGLATAFLYLAVQKIFEPLGHAGTISPLLAAWIPHVLFFLVGLFLLIRARK